MEITPTRELVLKKIRQMYPPSKQEEVMELLGVNNFAKQGEGPARIQLAILKLSNGRLDKLRYEINIARSDYRDVLAPAEYPFEIMNNHKWDKKSLAEQNAIREKDRQQYLNWLNDENEVFYESKKSKVLLRKKRKK